MADQCTADLADRCPGFEATEKAHQEFEANYTAIINGAWADECAPRLRSTKEGSQRASDCECTECWQAMEVNCK